MTNGKEYTQERKGPGRRDSDEECLAHEQRLDDMDNEVHKQSGWLKTGAGLLSIAIMCIGAFNGMIFAKLTVIEGLISDNKVTMMQHSERLKNLDERVRDVEERNKYIDQQSGLLGRGNR